MWHPIRWPLVSHKCQSSREVHQEGPEKYIYIYIFDKNTIYTIFKDMYNTKPLESQIPGGRDSESQQSSLIHLIG